MEHCNRYPQTCSWIWQQGCLGTPRNYRMLPRKVCRTCPCWRVHPFIKPFPFSTQRFWSHQRLWKAHCLRCKEFCIPQDMGCRNHCKTAGRQTCHQLWSKDRRSRDDTQDGCWMSSASCKGSYLGLQEDNKESRSCRKNQEQSGMGTQDNHQEL